ncbi:MAG: beta-ketoacyl-ACP reductase [Candidatus Sericytochromatia bacterium]
MKLKGKVVVLTGAAQGIGASIAKVFSSQGASLALIDKQEELLKKFADDLKKTNENISYFSFDITDKESVKDAISKIKEQYGRIDVLVNNAGVTRDSMSYKMTEENWDLVMDINLKAPFLLIQEVFPIMKEQKDGVILNASSVSSQGNVGQANYSASKAGLIGMTKSLALEFARYNVRVNCIAPGFTETEMIKTIPDEVKSKIVERVPMKRLAQPEEIADAYLFLASDNAKFITGQTLFVDGGLTCGF